MAAFTHSTTTLRRLLLPHRLTSTRSFINAKIKWVRDPYLDFAVEKEKNLFPLLSLKNLILSQPSKTLPLSSASTQKPLLHLPTTASKFIQKYPSVFTQFQPHPLSLPHLKLTPQALIAHNEETQILNSPTHKKDSAERLAKLLMLAGARKLPLNIIDRFKFDLGLPHNYILTLLPDFPDYFQVCDLQYKDSNGYEILGLGLGLELVSWREDLAISALERKKMDLGYGFRRGIRIRFPMEMPRGFDLQKRVKNWVEEFQDLPYISPYESAFHLNPNSDQAEKWVVAILHELLGILVSKKTDTENLYQFGDYLGFGKRFKRALVHHPGIFYVSNKIRTQTVVLREGYRKDSLVEKHPLMGMRYRYIYLMNKVVRQRRPIRRVGDVGCIKQRV